MKFCPQGHPHIPENRLHRKGRSATECLPCHRDRGRKYNARRVVLYQKPTEVAQDKGYSEPEIQGFLALADVLKTERVSQGSLATVGMARGVSPISLGERERGLKNKLKAVARFADLLGLEIHFIVRKKK